MGYRILVGFFESLLFHLGHKCRVPAEFNKEVEERIT